MNTKNNQRSKDTSTRIVKAVYRAITEEQKPLDRITVREICEEAQINRSTFYAHYQDVYDVVDKVEHTMSERLTQTVLARLDTAASVSDLFEEVFAFVGEYRAFYAVYLGQMHRAGVIGVAWELLQDRTAQLDYHSLGYRSQAELEYVGIFFINGLTAMLRRWLETGCQETPCELVEILASQYTPDRSLFEWGR